MADDDITIPRAVLQGMFDMAVSGMDFGSGFLGDEEVEQLRAVAVLLGVDPAAGTPENFRSKYNVPLDEEELGVLRSAQEVLATGFVKGYPRGTVRPVSQSDRQFYERKVAELEARPHG